MSIVPHINGFFGGLGNFDPYTDRDVLAFYDFSTNSPRASQYVHDDNTRFIPTSTSTYELYSYTNGTIYGSNTTGTALMNVFGIRHHNAGLKFRVKFTINILSGLAPFMVISAHPGIAGQNTSPKYRCINGFNEVEFTMTANSNFGSVIQFTYDNNEVGEFEAYIESIEKTDTTDYPYIVYDNRNNNKFAYLSRGFIREMFFQGVRYAIHTDKYESAYGTNPQLRTNISETHSTITYFLVFDMCNEVANISIMADSNNTLSVGTVVKSNNSINWDAKLKWSNRGFGWEPYQLYIVQSKALSQASWCSIGSLSAGAVDGRYYEFIAVKNINTSKELAVRNYLINKYTIDVDVKNFINRAGITGERQKTALNNFVKGLKDNRLWHLIVGLYPYCPIDDNTATSQAYSVNLREPFNLVPNSHNINWVGFNSSDFTIYGVTGGVGKYGKTNIILGGTISGFAGLSAYCRTDAASSGIALGMVQSGNTGRLLLNPRSTSDITLTGIFENSIDTSGANTTNAAGFYHVQRLSSSSKKVFKNGVEIWDSSAAGSGVPALELYLHACNGNGTTNNIVANEDTRQYAGFALTNPLTATQMAIYNTLWQTYQSEVIPGGRNV